VARGLTIQGRGADLTPALLAAAGAKPGEAVPLQLPNISQFLISYFGILKRKLRPVRLVIPSLTWHFT
jgi:non-ribosomal peptide synthetase component E (peptide arylation enzyme)